MNSLNPLVSVVIPLYNAEKYISETIQSVLNQTYSNFELIIVDDCSTDSSVKIVKDYEEQDVRVRLILSESNFGGPARPRNMGLKNANGKYIAFLDADDVWLKEKLELQVDILEANSNYDLVDANAYTIDEESKPLSILKTKKVFNLLKFFIIKENVLILSNYININTVLMKNTKEILFREDKNLIALEDWMFWIENIKNGKIIYLCPEYLIKYRIVNTSISNRSSDKGYRKSLYMLSVLLLEQKIPLRYYILSSNISLIKIILRGLRGR